MASWLLFSSQMETDALIKQDYFKMLIKLNSANRKANEITEDYFFIESTDNGFLKLYSTIKGQDQKILLCIQPERSRWRAVNFEYDNLSGFIAKLLLFESSHPDLTAFIKSQIFKFPT